MAAYRVAARVAWFEIATALDFGTWNYGSGAGGPDGCQRRRRSGAGTYSAGSPLVSSYGQGKWARCKNNVHTFRAYRRPLAVVRSTARSNPHGMDRLR